MDEDCHIKDKLNRINEMEEDEYYQFKLSGEPILDAAIVSRWIAKSYGETSQAYHEAYSLELFRQTRIATYGTDSDTKMKSWF